jgi:gas vesicle protein
MKTYGKVLIAVGAGLAAGVVLGILFAPDKGTETRKKISDAARDYSDRLKTMKDSITGKVKVAHNGHSKKASVEES